MYSEEEDNDSKYTAEVAIPLCLYNDKVKSKSTLLSPSPIFTLKLTFRIWNLRRGSWILKVSQRPHGYCGGRRYVQNRKELFAKQNDPQQI